MIVIGMKCEIGHFLDFIAGKYRQHWLNK